VQVPERGVTIIAEQASHCARHVVMVNMQVTLLPNPANGTGTTLPLEKCIVVPAGKAAVVFPQVFIAHPGRVVVCFSHLIQADFTPVVIAIRIRHWTLFASHTEFAQHILAEFGTFVFYN
jgi:hypothetical protein